MNLLFTELPSPKMHPANIGHDLERNGLPLEGLKRKQYLDRALKFELFRDDFKNVPSDLHTVFLTGAKVIANAYAPKTMGDWDDQRLTFISFYTELAHKIDPELIFDAYITDEIHKTVEYVKISPEAFEKLGLAPENRKFSFALMDTETERELWFCHRALQFKAAGFDCLTFGEKVPKKIVELFKKETPLVFHGCVIENTRSPETETPLAIAEYWVGQKQLEG